MPSSLSSGWIRVAGRPVAYRGLVDEWTVLVIGKRAFGRGIPAGGVAPPSNTPGMFGRRALPSGRRAPKSHFTNDKYGPLGGPLAAQPGDRALFERQRAGDLHRLLGDDRVALRAERSVEIGDTLGTTEQHERRQEQVERS